MFINGTTLHSIMVTDIVFPNNDENEYIKLAERLNIKKLVFCYDFSKIKTAKLPLKQAILVKTNDINKAKNLNLPLISNRNDRFIFDQKYTKKPMILYNLENISAQDSLHSRHSGLNQILCKLAKKNNIILGLSLSQILNETPQKRAQIIGRLIQNIKLARKYKVKIKLASFATSPYQLRAPSDLQSFGIMLGLHPKEATQAQNEELF